MLRRWTRRLGSLGVLWTLVVSNSPVPLHPCPEMSGDEAVAAMGTDDAHAHHGGAGSIAGATDEAPAATQCECIDCSCIAMPVGIMAVAESAVAELAGHAVTPAVTADARGHHVSLRLPHANGPPATAL